MWQNLQKDDLSYCTLNHEVRIINIPGINDCDDIEIIYEVLSSDQNAVTDVHVALQDVPCRLTSSQH